MAGTLLPRQIQWMRWLPFRVATSSSSGVIRIVVDVGVIVVVERVALVAVVV